jgi:PAS domain S-box-containing protein
MGQKRTFRKSLSEVQLAAPPASAVTEDAIQRNNRRYRDLIDSLPLTVFEIDRQARVVFANRHAINDSGYSLEELRGMSATQFFIPQDRVRIEENIGKILTGERVSGNEYTVLRKDGSTFPAVIYSNSTIQDGQLTGVTGVFVDISDRNTAEKALRESDAKHRTLLENLPQKIFQKDTNSVFISCNGNFARELGIDPTEVKGKTDYDFYSKELADKFRAHDKKVVESGKTEILEWVVWEQDTEQWHHAVKTPLKDEHHNITGVLGIFWDITEIKQAEDELKKTEELFRNLVENIAIGVSLISPKMEILTLNRQMKKWFPEVDPAKRPLCYEVFNNPPRNGVCSYCPTHKTLRDGLVHEAITATPVGDEIKNYRIVSSPIRDIQGNIDCAIEMVEDITEKRHVAEQIHSLTKALLTTQESERLMLSRELHDSLAQDLAAAKIHCDITMGRSSSGQPVPENSLKHISDILIKCIATVRRLAYDLRPSDLIQFGIVETLRKHCRDFSETHLIPVDFQAGGFNEIKMSDTLSINIFRLVQEGLNNIMKHASASHVFIRLFATFPHIILRIEDDGKGFDVRKRQASITEEKRLGLRSMQERVDLLGGSMNIDSKPGFGTKLFIKILYGERLGDFKKNHINR